VNAHLDSRVTKSKDQGAKELDFVDTSFRDGVQSLWASGIRSGMIDAVSGAIDQAGFAAAEVPASGNFFKKLVRDAKEDPWQLARLIGRRMPRTTKSAMAGAHILPFEPPPPRELVRLFYSRLAETGALNRVQLACNTVDQAKLQFPWTISMFKSLGLKIAVAISYSISPRHTDTYYGEKVREVLAFKPDCLYLKDQGGLLTVERARTLLPVLVRNAGTVPVELHSHCTTGLAPLVYLEALHCGVRILHTAIPPLANGSSQPSIFNVANNARLLGYVPKVDVQVLKPAAERLAAIARREGLAIGAPLAFDQAQYVHQVPGGVISNLTHQLAQLRIDHRLDEVLSESVRVRADLGYPIMITPHSQFVVTQAAINVAMGERYKHVIDELILFAQGAYGEDSGCPWMDQDLKDRLLGSRRARELASRKTEDVPLSKLREQFGGAGASDEEFLLRFIMKGSREIEAMRAAGPPREYLGAELPIVELVRRLTAHRGIGYVCIRRGADAVLLSGPQTG
jgi:oxaloacetate decarboxylase alpha subunit